MSKQDQENEDVYYITLLKGIAADALKLKLLKISMKDYKSSNSPIDTTANIIYQRMAVLRDELQEQLDVKLNTYAKWDRQG